MRKIASIFAALGLSLALAGCGGGSSTCGNLGGGSGSTTTCTGNNNNNGGSQTLQSVSLSSSPATVPADGSATSTISATVLDTTGKPIAGVQVAFTTTAGTLSTSSTATNSSGVATTVLTAKGVTAASITVTGAVSTVQGTTTLSVTGGSGSSSNSISIMTSLPQIASDGSQPATITAIVRDTNNNLVPGVTVAFSATSGGLAVTQPTSDANGQAKATLTPANDPSFRVITVTASAQGKSATVPVTVVGTTLNVSGPATLIQGAQGTFSVTLLNSAGNGIPNQTLTLASASGNALSVKGVTVSSVMTDASGSATFTLTATNSGADTVTAAGLGLTSQQTVAVSNQSFAFTPLSNTTIPIGASQQVTVTWTSAGSPQAGQTVTFSSTRGTVSAQQVTTDSKGVAQVNISSTTSGPATITATGTNVSAQLAVTYLATTPATVDVQASPATIAPQGVSTITATVRDANDNLVKNQTVIFNLVQDATGGSLSPGSATTNGQGQATVTYTASGTSSATNGVVISATVGSIVSKTNLTVAGQTVGLSLGTGGKIIELSSTQDKMPWTVTAGNASSNGVPNVPITFTVKSLSYLKGEWFVPAGKTTWSFGPTISSTDPDAVFYGGTWACASEDVNNNGVLDTGEDYNQNGKLDPGLVATTDIPSGTTDANGSITVNLIYPKDHAQWVVVRLIATATVNGTENSQSVDVWLPALASDIPSSNAASPPGQFSPYGQASACSDKN